MSTVTPPTDSELIAYKANCHCKAVTFTARLPPLSTLELSNCNCSICTRNGYIMAYPARENVEYHTGADNLAEFRFASEKAVHRFCKTCGSSVGAEMTFGDKVMLAVNVRLFQDVDLSTMKYKHSDRKDYGGSFQYPEFPLDSGITPSEPSLVPYHGSCQCKAVSYTTYLPSLSEAEVIQCNCSICTANGYILAFAKMPDIAFHSGEDRLTTYTFGSHKALHKFCQSCGSSILIDVAGLGLAHQWSMNVRMFKDVDLKDLKYKHVDGPKTLI
ncbi:hypothetical protein FIBSPDRAFT_867306 [Athelia psychrophila]|uniref:CENP-V/GFA domain-containing protein n=1 Tax=Athelia psychrophila TaxID=1759441 RepID=A0A166E476_9AGAM|nr:hypothetical protein FIBSPDRAFT_867306 [Fibularhizoctonia sp. CBS 109695]